MAVVPTGQSTWGQKRWCATSTSRPGAAARHQRHWGQEARGLRPAGAAGVQRSGWITCAQPGIHALNSIKSIKFICNSCFSAYCAYPEFIRAVGSGSGRHQKGAPSFMGNMYLHEKTARKPSSLAARHLPQFLSADVSTEPGCVRRVLRSTSR